MMAVLILALLVPAPILAKKGGGGKPPPEPPPPPPPTEEATCNRNITANVAAFDQVYFLNRLGAVNNAGMIYALERDIVTNTGTSQDPVWTPITQSGLSTDDLAGKVQLRPDKRARPIVLRMNAGDCLTVNFKNLLNPVRVDNEQPVTRDASIHVNGMQLVGDIADDGSFVGRNASSLTPPGGENSYTFYAEINRPPSASNAYALYSMGSITGAQGAGGTISFGLFGGVNVEPEGAEWYRSHLTHEEMALANDGNGTTGNGQPILNYDTVYPNTPVFIAEGKAGLPVLRIQCKAGDPAVTAGDCLVDEIVHSDIHAVITGPNRGNFTAGTHYPSTPINPQQEQPFREFSSIWNGEQVAIQAFPALYLDPVLKHTLAIVVDSFIINYGSGGIGSEIIANRLGVGPMYDCVDCKFEEFFLTSWTVGDPAMIVDVPANAGGFPPAPGPKATTALFPDDPSNVHHAYMNDHVKFRNIHAGPFEHHIFHLHGHQWVFAPQSDKANYQDMQQIGPGVGYTYDMVNGGTGNRHKTPGDAIYHCHFYPHFAMGMWAMYRIHEVFEEGTVVEGEVNRAVWSMREGRPVVGARALVDGEVGKDLSGNCIGMCRGTPIPAVVPIPGLAMAPMPAGNPRVDPADPRKWIIDPLGSGQTPGFPFWIAGIGGHRPPTPPLDLLDDGGLPRHVVTSGVADSVVDAVVTRLDFAKELLVATAMEIPEGGTPVEIETMNFHAQRTHLTSVQPKNITDTNDSAQFITNGLPPQPGAPFSDPCVDNTGAAVLAGGTPLWADATGAPNFKVKDGLGNEIPVTFGVANPRTYKVSMIQADVVFNKVGWHFNQQRFLTFWEDAAPVLAGQQAPEPFVFRLNTLDCAEIQHTNLVPSAFELDDYEIRTPTDVIGQHVHLPKFDLPAADGAANGWNYEDGTFSPGEVIERIHAFNAGGGMHMADGTVRNDLEPEPHPFFTGVSGARTTVQRWFADPVFDKNGVDRGLNNSFTHDHYGPSTHQQIGHYQTVLMEPAGSRWVDNETGQQLGDFAAIGDGGRQDGGPTSWQAVILPPDERESFREFFLEWSDFQSAYERNWDGRIDADSFLEAINPSVRAEVFPQILAFEGVCPGGVPRPCPEAISGADVGTYVLNYRNEPVGLRIFDPEGIGPDGFPGAQTGQLTSDRAGDLSFAFASRQRAIGDLNDVQQSCIRATPQDPERIIPPGEGIAFADVFGRDAVPVDIDHNIGPELPCPQLTADVGPRDPATPMMRAYVGDRIRVRAQVGATEESHFFSMHGLKWLMNYADPASGWRNTQSMGISEQFQFNFPMFVDVQGAAGTADFWYASDTSNNGVWNGTWGLARAYQRERDDLVVLPNNPVGRGNAQIVNNKNFDGFCPKNAQKTPFDITAVRVADVLPDDPVLGIKTLVYNSRQTSIPDFVEAGVTFQGGDGPLHDPTAMIYVMTDDLETVDINDPGCYDEGGKPKSTLPTCPQRLVAGAIVEPIILRVNSGDCVEVTLRNRVTHTKDTPVPDLNGLDHLVGIVDRIEQVDPVTGVAQKVSFNKNDIIPSNEVGLHPQLLSYNLLDGDGANIGQNQIQTISPGQNKKYQWYAGDLRVKNKGVRRGRVQFEMIATDVEFGCVGLMPSDKIEQMAKGLVGAICVMPDGATWVEDPGTRAQATVTVDGASYRDFVSVTQTAVQAFYADGSPVQQIEALGPLGVSEDTEDSGMKAINYKSEPFWFRLAAFPPHIDLNDQRDFFNADVLSNTVLGVSSEFPQCATVGSTDPLCDPQTPVFSAVAADPVRMHFVEPGGHTRAHLIKVHGHLWQRSPYGGIVDFDGDGILDGSTTIASNPVSQMIGGQEGYGAGNFFHLILENGAGGAFQVDGDYFYGMQEPGGSYSGMWGVFRVDPKP
jgi:hypothetical protein